MFGAEDPFSVLTERELDVLHELAQGLSNKQIASVLNISRAENGKNYSISQSAA